MKKKILSMFVALITTISLLSASVYAANGPMGEISYGDETYYFAYINFLETDENGQVIRDDDFNAVGKTVFSNNTVQNELAGAVYNRNTNTLTITNLSADNMILETNVMGDDFTLNVVGNCSIGQIKVWGDGYGGTLNIVGDGTLTVNANKIYDNAIVLNAESSNSALKFGAGVKVNLYAKEDVAVVCQVPLDSADKVYDFANGQNPDIRKDLNKYQTTKWIQGFEIVNPADEGAYLPTVDKVEYSKDPTGLYGSNFSNYYSDGQLIAEGYRIVKLVYIEKYNAYFQDKNFGDEFGELFIEEKDFAASDFKMVVDENEKQEQYENVYDHISSYQVYVDSSGKEYALGYDYENGERIEYALDFEPIEGLEDTYALTKNTSVNVSDLEPAFTETISEGLYDYTLTGTSFTYDGSNVSESKPIKLVDIGNVWIWLTPTDVMAFTTEINPNEPGLTDQMEILEETWISGTTVIKKSAPAKGIAGKTYSYSITLKAKNGYVFDDDFTFIYGGSTPANYKYSISDDKKTMTLSGFIKDVTVASSNDVTAASSNDKTTAPVVKAKQPMKVTVKQKSVKLSKLKKKKQLVKKAVIAKKAQGTVTYTKVKKGSSARLSINKKTGAITVKKGTKKGTYKIKVKVTAKGNEKYLAGSKTVTVKIKVK